MSDTPRTDSAGDFSKPDQMFRESRAIERELNEARAKLAEAEERRMETVMGCELLTAELAALRKDKESARWCIVFFASVIKSGEPWTATCQSEYDAALAQPRAETHPEDSCGDCGRSNPVWHAPNDLWNSVMRDGSMEPIICPICFINRATAKGIKCSSWLLTLPATAVPSDSAANIGCKDCNGTGWAGGSSESRRSMRRCRTCNGSGFAPSSTRAGGEGV